MRRILLAAAALTLWSGAALAADDVMAGFYGNTVISTGNGIETRTHYKADGHLEALFSAMGQSASTTGTWKVAAGQLCRTYDSPPQGVVNPSCIPAEAHKVGDSWTVTVNGAVREVKLVAGIQ